MIWVLQYAVSAYKIYLIRFYFFNGAQFFDSIKNLEILDQNHNIISSEIIYLKRKDGNSDGQKSVLFFHFQNFLGR